MFNGLTETLDEAIRYRIGAPPGRGAPGPVVLAGPSCDSADVLYEKSGYQLPADLRIGDRLQLMSAGAYTASYSTVWFNGFEPLRTFFVSDWPRDRDAISVTAARYPRHGAEPAARPRPGTLAALRKVASSSPATPAGPGAPGRGAVSADDSCGIDHAAGEAVRSSRRPAAPGPGSCGSAPIGLEISWPCPAARGASSATSR